MQEPERPDAYLFSQHAIITMEGFWNSKFFFPTPNTEAVAPMNHMQIITDGGVPLLNPSEKWLQVWFCSEDPTNITKVTDRHCRAESSFF